jgi:hypothetical protein
MTIQVSCPNGHSLQVNEIYAGRAGLCPLCKARIEIPKPVRTDLTEDAILGFLGPYDPKHAHATAVPDGAAPKDRHSPASPSPPKKSCEKCNREILAATHICPFCHTYIAGLSDF